MIFFTQTRTIETHGHGDCFNACVATILKLPLEDTLHILPEQTVNWHDQWNDFLADKGYKLATHSKLNPPSGYSIGTVTTDRRYPDSHVKAGQPITHAVVCFDGMIIHDPCGKFQEKTKIKYFETLVFLTYTEKQLRFNISVQ